MVKPETDNASREPLIHIEQLSVDFGLHEVLRDIDLSSATGETLAIIGESGCGKTVLLKTIIGLLATDPPERCCSTAKTGLHEQRALTESGPDLASCSSRRRRSTA